MRDGIGEIQWFDDSKYIGEWKQDKIEGKGKFIHPNGDYYDGEWQNSKANGKGIYYDNNGSKYNGNWKND